MHTDFEKDFMPLMKQAYSFAFRLTFDEDQAKDLVQDTYVKAFRFYESYERGTNAKAWLFRVLKNTFINDYRKKAKEPFKYDYQEIEEYYNADGATREPDKNLQIEDVNDMMGDEMTKALQSLQEEFREIIILCDLEDLKYEEIAQILDIPVGTVRSRLHRARHALKEKIKEYAKTLGYK
ncbi:MAG: sigma-70 family RNA polymerase sigma factor [Cytophagales bacterium]|nr:MAG: sigma-70 family RNA polymerase sigma factor [Cytophagales bacterium]